MQKFNRHPLWHRSLSWLNSTMLGISMVVLLWFGIAAKHIENRAHDIAVATQDMQNFSLLFEENVLRSIGEIDKALLYLRRTIQNTKEPLNFHGMIGTSDVLSDLIIQVAIIDAHGIMRASNVGPQPAPPTDLNDREHYRFHVGRTKDQLFISKPVVGRASGKWSVQLTRRFNTSEGAFGGVIVASFNPEHFSKFYGRIDLGSGSTFALIGTDGVVRATGGDEHLRFALGHDLVGDQRLAHVGSARTEVFSDLTTIPGMPRLVAARKVAGQPLLVSLPRGNQDESQRQSG